MTTTLILTIAFFLTVILMLVSLLLFVKAKLSPAGKLKITINGEQTLEVEEAQPCCPRWATTGCSFLQPVEAVALVSSANAKSTLAEVPSCPPRPRTSRAKRSPTTGALDAK